MEDLEAAAAPGLGPVHGHVALPDAFLRPEVRAVADDHAGRGGDDELPLAEPERLGEAGEEPLDDARGLALGVEVLEEGDELVAAEAGQGVAGP